MYKIKKINEKTVYYSTLLENVEHFFTTRELPINGNEGIIADYLNISVDNLINPTQTHTDNIQAAKVGKRDYPDTDALILTNKEQAVFLRYADCTPVILYDKVQNIGAVIHAGWRGTANKIAQKTALKMQELYNVHFNDMVALIGACISFEEFETSEEAITLLKASVSDSTGLFKNRNADLKGINKRQLEEIKIKEIDVCPFCTVKDNDKFFSYRKENGTPLRHNALLKLK